VLEDADGQTWRARINKVARIAELLTAGDAEPPNILLKAPLGWGKSAVIQGCIEAAGSWGFSTALVSIRKSHNDTARLGQALTGAIALATNVPVSQLATPEAVHNAIARQPKRLLIGLDCLDGLQAPEALGVLQEWLGLVEDGLLTVILGCSVRPDIGLGRLSRRTRLITLGPDYLAFTLEQVQDLLVAGISPEDAVSFFVHTGGWPLAITLLQNVFANGRSKISADAAMSAIIADVATALREEMFATISHGEAQMLMASAVLGRLPEDSLIGAQGRVAQVAPALYADLHPLATLHLETGRCGFLPVFQKALQHLHTILGKQSPAELHRAIACSLHSKGRLVEAFEHASQADDPQLMLSWFRAAGGPEIGLRDGTTKLRLMLGQFPVPMLETIPDLMLAEVLLFLKDGNLDLARAVLDRLHRLLASQESASMVDQTIGHRLMVVRGLLAVYTDSLGHPESLADLRRYVEENAATTLWGQGILENILCMSYFFVGDMQRASEAAERALDIYVVSRTCYSQVFMHVHCALIAMVRADQAQVRSHLAQAMELAAAHFPDDEGLIALPRCLQAVVALENNDFQEAQRLMDSALDPLERFEGWAELFVRVYPTAVTLALASKGQVNPNHIIQRGFRTARRRRLKRLEIALEALELEVMALDPATEVDRLEAGIKNCQARIADDSLSFHEQYRLAWAIGLASLVCGDPEPSILLLETSLQRQRDSDHLGFELRTLVLLALTREAVEPHEADLLFAQALSHISAHGGLRSISAETGMLRHFTKRFLARGSLALVDKNATAALGQVLIEGTADRPASGTRILSEREHEVLHELSRGASNKHIARTFNLTEATVKFHVRNIFDKLGVRNRLLAIEVARQKGLL
jgi:LuxR family transcriptional regulator, maltose regulon positive regulatory protein